MNDDLGNPSPSISDRYARAVAYLPSRLGSQLWNTDFEPVWIEGEDRFWYRREHEHGHEFILVDATRGQIAPAFDHKALAMALTTASGHHCDPTCLPFMHFTLQGAKVRFRAHRESWQFDPADATCRRIAASHAAPEEVISPDGSGIAFLRSHNLWLRDCESGEERQLTHDGCAGMSYAKSPDCNNASLSNQEAGVPLPAALVWSPDSRYFVTHKLDEQDVPLLHFLQSAPDDGIRPKLHSLHVAFPGDLHVATQSFVIVDTITGRLIPIDTDPIIALQVSSIELMNV